MRCFSLLRYVLLKFYLPLNIQLATKAQKNLRQHRPNFELIVGRMVSLPVIQHLPAVLLNSETQAVIARHQSNHQTLRSTIDIALLVERP